MRRALPAMVAVGICLSAATITVAQLTAAGAQTGDDTGIDHDAGDDTGDGEPEIPAGAGRIIGTPEAGPNPQHSGDRGGWAQLLTLGVIAGGVGFIMWRIISAARQAPGSTEAGP